MSKEINLRWLGTAGLEFSVGERILAIDPFFTRPSLGKTLFGRVRSDGDLAASLLPLCDHLLISHAHYDHLMDVPEVIKRTGARAYGSKNACMLLSLLGVPEEKINTIGPGDRFALADIQVDVLQARHRSLFGLRVATGPLDKDLRPPLRATEYKMDLCFSFTLRIGEISIFVGSGLGDGLAPPADVLLVAPYGREADFQILLEGVRPRVVIPNHWDDFFRPLSSALRMMHDPSDWKWPPLRRIDLNAFERVVHTHAPQAQLLIPEVLKQYDVTALLDG